MGKGIFASSLRRYTKLQSMYLSGPGSVRPLGIKQVFGIACAAPCTCHPGELENGRWTELLHTDLAQRLGVQGLVEPAMTEVPEGRFMVDSATLLDVWRFPSTEYCTGCQALQSWSEASGSGSRSRGADALGWCFVAHSPGHKRRKQTLQFEFVWVCPEGHMDSYSPWCPACGAHLKRAGMATDFAVPLQCSSCDYEVEITLEDTRECSGLIPNAMAVGDRSAACLQRMRLRRLTDPSVWRARMLTALHLPRHVLLSEEQYDAICEAMAGRAYERKTSAVERVSYIGDKLLEAGLEVGVDKSQIQAVIERAKTPVSPGDSDQLDLDLRRAEIDAFRELQDRDIDMPLLVGARAKQLLDGPFVGASGLERLRATTVLTSVSRLDGPASRALIWGHQPGHAQGEGHGWLPAFESFGEGLLLWIDSEWCSQLANPYEAVHTCSHVAVRGLAKHAGISETAVRERIYVDPLPAVLLYVATGDQVGTLGGLASLAHDAKWLSEVLHDEVQAQHWCSMDPICEVERNGACHHCLYLSETSCEGVSSGRGLQHNAQLRRGCLEDWW